MRPLRRPTFCNPVWGFNLKLIELSLALSLWGALCGTLAAIVSIMHNRRDRARLQVTLLWDQKVPHYRDPNRLWGVVIVANVGRRPAHLSGVLLQRREG